MTSPTSTEQDRLLQHDYDGIQEFDNPLPRWWVYLFYATIVFAIAYWLNVGGIGTGSGRIAAYDAEMKAFAAAHPPEAGAALPTAESLAALASDTAALARGKAVYAANCAACHGPAGGGLIGPNLTDEYWLHGGTLPEVRKTVAEGVLAKGMPPWGKTLKPDQVSAVAAYVVSLQGTKPASPKAPEGRKAGA